MKYNYIVIAFIAVLSLSIVSAWSISLTGNVVKFGLSENDQISETDDGLNEGVGGLVYVNRPFMRIDKVFLDSCVGKMVNIAPGIKGQLKISEVYIDSDENQVLSRESGEDVLGPGYCVVERINFLGKNFSVAKWVNVTPSCEETPEGVVNHFGQNFSNKCTGKTFLRYSCDGDLVKSEKQECARCSNMGCLGNCAGETDAENDKAVPGLLTFDGKNYSDKCYGRGAQSGVIQYKCDGERMEQLRVEFCGANKECVDNGQGAFCRDSVAGTGTISDINSEIADLRSRVDGMKTEILQALNRCRVISTGNSQDTGNINCERSGAGRCIFGQALGFFYLKNITDRTTNTSFNNDFSAFTPLLDCNQTADQLMGELSTNPHLFELIDISGGLDVESQWICCSA